MQTRPLGKTGLQLPILGFGASSIGQSAQGYVQNASDIKAWRDRIEAGELATVRGLALSEDDALRGDFMEEPPMAKAA